MVASCSDNQTAPCTLYQEYNFSYSIGDVYFHKMLIGDSSFDKGFLNLWYITAIVGDITPSDNVPKEEKNRLESAAINEMCTMLGNGFEGK